MPFSQIALQLLKCAAVYLQKYIADTKISMNIEYIYTRKHLFCLKFSTQKKFNSSNKKSLAEQNWQKSDIKSKNQKSQVISSISKSHIKSKSVAEPNWFTKRAISSRNATRIPNVQFVCQAARGLKPVRWKQRLQGPLTIIIQRTRVKTQIQMQIQKQIPKPIQLQIQVQKPQIEIRALPTKD